MESAVPLVQTVHENEMENTNVNDTDDQNGGKEKRSSSSSTNQTAIGSKPTQTDPTDNTPAVTSATNDISPSNPTLTPRENSPEHPQCMPILNNGLFAKCFGGALGVAHPFNWDRVLADPKANHGTFSMRWCRTVTYHLLHTGGFLRLATERGRVYWLAQNETMHTTPDWKLHFSIVPRAGRTWEQDIGAAWNVLAALFLERCCDVGMKARYAPWLEQGQQGRELTVYIFKFDPKFDKDHVGGPMAGLSEPNQEHLFHLSQEFEGFYDAEFWASFIQEAERLLLDTNLSPGGVADGDLALPGCRFASIRNEAFIKIANPHWTVGDHPSTKEEFAYPPNSAGWNAAGHVNPLETTIRALQVATDLSTNINRLSAV
eukprot:m.262632 g.262632  ORF g.262632 m.262632 type:complete len:374 (+) comp46464_c0_seq1:211-1332(+)